MQKFDHDEVRTVVEAPPEAVWEVIADITRMPQLSPEVVESRWLDGATEATVGARFVAKSKFSRGPAIGNKPVITAVDANRRISWSRTEPFGGTVEWTYELTPHADGTEVIESYRAIEPVSRFGWVAKTRNWALEVRPRTGIENVPSFAVSTGLPLLANPDV